MKRLIFLCLALVILLGGCMGQSAIPFCGILLFNSILAKSDEAKSVDVLTKDEKAGVVKRHEFMLANQEQSKRGT